MDIQAKLNVLSRIASELNRRSLTWAAGGSLMLYLREAADDFHDLDLLVAEADVEQARTALLHLGAIEQPSHSSPDFATRHFSEWEWEGVEIDLLAGFAILRDGREYYFPLQKEPCRDAAAVNGERVPLQTLALWRTCYELMGRADKVALIDAHQHPGQR